MALLSKRRFTVPEYHKMAAAGILGENDRVELVEGEIVEMRPIGSRQAAQVNRVLATRQRATAGRAIVSVQNPIHLDDLSEPQPDVALLQPRADYDAAGHPEPADVLLLVAVPDTSVDHDRQIQLPLYARAGIPAVWLIDLALPGVVEAYENPSVDGFARVTRVAAGETLGLAHLPDLAVEVSDLCG